MIFATVSSSPTFPWSTKVISAVAVIAPAYFAFRADELLEHFVAAAEACAPLPFYVYENADRTGYAVPASVVEQLRERVANLSGLKVSDAPFGRVQPYLATGLDVFIGAESLIPQGLENGAVGAVSGVAAAFPDVVSELVREPTAERAALVKSLRVVLSKHGFQSSLKAVLGFGELPVASDVRAPLRPLPAGTAEQLRDELDALLAAPSARRAAGNHAR